MSQVLIGAHVSAAGGIEKAPKRAADIGCNAVQIFTSSPRTWQPADPEKIDADAFAAECVQHNIQTNVIHAIYLVNLASNKPELVEKSSKILIGDLKIASQINSVGVVVHLGSHQGRGYEAMREQMIDEIKNILDQTPVNSNLLIENSAGQNGKIASNLEEIKDLIEAVDSPRLGWCLDSCHAHAAGYSLEASNKKQDPGNESKNIISEIERLGLWKQLKCVHINDSRDAFASGKDRHDNLGEGNINLDAFKSFVNHPRIKTLPLILEVPGFNKKGPDKENIDILKAWLGL